MRHKDEAEELAPREDIGTTVSTRTWLMLIAGALLLVLSLAFAAKRYLESKGPVAIYEKQLELEEQEQ